MNINNLKNWICCLCCFFFLFSGSLFANSGNDTILVKKKSLTFPAVQKITEGFRFGINISPTFARLKTEGDQLASEGTSTYFSYGIIFDKYFHKERYAFSTGINIINKGGKVRNYSTDAFILDELPGQEFANTEIKYNLRYLEIPLLVRLRSEPIKDKFVAYGTAGITPGIRLKSRGEINEFEDIKFNKEVQFFNASLTYGLGIEYPLTAATTLMAGLNFNTGLPNISKNIGRIESNHVALQFGIFF